ncbi:hypothetical protein IWZ03DRAFT_61155 [Phyllosticta citriasiana]|uniref:Uncharacterized protein n=1 Tax=Phyllosticta citriasiana TaxID=595635 RepID=A0ABR1KBA1_9PEZI
MGIHALPRPAIPVTTQSMLGFSRRSIISHTHSLQCPPIAPENQDGQPCALLASTFLRSGFQTTLSRRQPASAPAHACRFKRGNIQNHDHQSRSQPWLDHYSSDDLSLVASIRVRWRMLSSIRRAAPTTRIATSRKHQQLALPSLPSDRYVLKSWFTGSLTDTSRRRWAGFSAQLPTASGRLKHAARGVGGITLSAVAFSNPSLVPVCRHRRSRLEPMSRWTTERLLWW